MWKFILAISVCLVQFSNAYKILVIFPVPGKSHGILGDGFVRHLLNAGHEITYVTPFPTKNPPPNLHYINATLKEEDFPMDLVNIQKILDKEVNMQDVVWLFNVVINLNMKTIEHENVQKLLTDPTQHFDLVLAEWFFTEVYSGFASVFNCPLIWSSSVEPHWMVLQLIDEIPNPAFNVDMQSLNTVPLDFFQRATELWNIIFTSLVQKFYIQPRLEEAYNKNFGPAAALRGRTLKPLQEMRYDASLMFGNSHVSLGVTTKLPMNYIAVGGYHINTDLKPLPKDIKNLMDNSKDGVIYFSMGSNLKSKDWPETLKKGLLRTFGSLKQTVLWKFEEALEDLPKNVHILKWAPQPSILAHPNCRLFITHGGLLSTTETIHYGVPTIGIPVFADQFTNVNRAVNKGYAKKVDLTYNIAEDLKVAIDEALNNPKYSEAAKHLSMIYHDRPVPPGQEVVHWTEHVIKTRGAQHLRSPALLLPWYQKMYLDLAALILAIVLVVYATLRRLCCRNKTVPDKSRGGKKNN